MKKITALLFVTLIVILPMLIAATAACAETIETPAPTEAVTTPPTAQVEVPPDPSEPVTPFTWQYLATIAGATAATLLIVQFLKVPLDHVWKIPTRLFVYLIALALMLVATALTTGLTANNSLLAVVNAFVVALAAYGSYEVTFAKFSK